MEVFQALYGLSKLLVSEQHPDATARILLERVRELCQADRGFLVVREADRWVPKLNVDFDRAKISDEEWRFSRTLVMRAIESGQIVRLEVDGEAGSIASVTQSRSSVRVAPLAPGGKVFGAIYLERAEGTFGAEVDVVLAEVAETAALLLRRAVEREALRQRNRSLEHDLFARHDFRGIVARDPGMLELLRVVGQVADSSASVLVTGESGTGKELIARALHVNSARARRDLVTLHCAALPASLLEAELFGHVRGAFTGAAKDRPGRIAAADGGTLFLDEVAEIAPEVQAKLLRFLQFGEIQRIGSDRIHKVDVRVVAATHRDLAALMAENRFRQDLYFRLGVVTLAVPPLRDRPGDILAIADEILRRRWRRPGTPRFTVRAESALAAYGYPGNVRELENIVERACLLAAGPEIDVELLPGDLQRGAPPASRYRDFTLDELADARTAAVEDAEREFVLGVVERADGNVSLAARRSGMNRTYLQRLLRRYRP